MVGAGGSRLCEAAQERCIASGTRGCTKLDPALRGLELDAAVEGVAAVVLAGADDHFARALAGRDQAAAQRMLVVLEPVLDIVGAQAGQPVVDRRQAGGA